MRYKNKIEYKYHKNFISNMETLNCSKFYIYHVEKIGNSWCPMCRPISFCDMLYFKNSGVFVRTAFMRNNYDVSIRNGIKTEVLITDELLFDPNLFIDFYYDIVWRKLNSIETDLERIFIEQSTKLQAILKERC